VQAYAVVVARAVSREVRLVREAQVSGHQDRAARDVRESGHQGREERDVQETGHLGWLERVSGAAVRGTGSSGWRYLRT
jgi:hypothetical protein